MFLIEKTGKDIVLLENYISYWKKVLEQMTDLAVRFSEGDISIKIEIIIVLVIIGMGIWLCLFAALQKGELGKSKMLDEFETGNWILMLILVVMTLGIFTIFILLNILTQKKLTKYFRARINPVLFLAEVIIIVFGIVLDGYIISEMSEEKVNGFFVLNGVSLAIIIIGLFIGAIVAAYIMKVKKACYFVFNDNNYGNYSKTLKRVDGYSRYGVNPQDVKRIKEKEVMKMKFLDIEQVKGCKGLTRVRADSGNGVMDLYKSNWYLTDIVVTFISGCFLTVFLCTKYIFEFLSLL